MRLPHWLAHRWGSWSQYKVEVEAEQPAADYAVWRSGPVPTFWQVRQRRLCTVCHKMQDELVR